MMKGHDPPTGGGSREEASDVLMWAYRVRGLGRRDPWHCQGTTFASEETW